MKLNTLNNIERGPSRDHFCQVWLESIPQFRRRCSFKKLRMEDDDNDRRHPSQQLKFFTKTSNLDANMDADTDAG